MIEVENLTEIYGDFKFFTYENGKTDLPKIGILLLGVSAIVFAGVA